MNLIMYSTGCPKCRVLKTKLDTSGLPFTVNDDIDEMMALGFRSVPVLSVDGEFYTYADAVRWVNERIQEKKSAEEQHT